MTALVLAAAAFVAWLVSTVTGGAGGLLLVPVIQFLLGASAVAPVATLGVFIGGPMRVWLFWRHVRWEIVRWYLPAAVVGAAIGGWIFANTESEWLTIVLALFLISSIVQFRFGEKERSFPMPRWAFAPLGFVVALVSGIVGALGPVLNPFYINYGVQREGMIATKSVNSLAMHLVKIGSYTVFGAMEVEYVRYGVVVGVAASLASWIGKRLLGKMTNKLFRQLVIGIMVITGFLMLWQQRHVLGWSNG